jgi:Glycosyltransferase family 9 (heptosyltransferase)
LSLPLAMNTRLDTIPARIPYLSTTSADLTRWKEKLGPKDATRIGIVWSGRPELHNDHNRSIALSKLVPLERLGVKLVALQTEVRAEDQKTLEANKTIVNFASDLHDFSDTAALTSLMDLVISVDTSVAHLAGALGKPVWILLPFDPDWRWLLGRDDSPWYPTARLFRQPKIGDWDSVIEEVKKKLKAWI